MRSAVADGNIIVIGSMYDEDGYMSQIGSVEIIIVWCKRGERRPVRAGSAKW